MAAGGAAIFGKSLPTERNPTTKQQIRYLQIMDNITIDTELRGIPTQQDWIEVFDLLYLSTIQYLSQLFEDLNP